MRVPPCVDEGGEGKGAVGCASSFQRMAPVIPAKAGIQRARQRSAHGAEGCVRRSRAGPVIPAKAGIQARNEGAPCVDEGGGCKRAEGCASSFQRMAPVIPAKAGIQRARQRSAHGAEGCVRRSRAGPVIPAKAGIQARNEGAPCVDEGGGCKRAEGCASSFQRMAPVIPAKAGIQRARQRSAHGAEGCVRRSRAGPVIPAKAGIQARNEGAPCVDEGGGCKRAEGCASSFQRMAPVIPAKDGIQRARQRSAHRAEGRRGVSAVPAQAPSFQRRLESRQGMRVPLVWMRVEDVSVRRGAPRRSSAWPPSFQRRMESSVRGSGAHTGRRDGGVCPPFPRRPRHSSEGWNPGKE